MGSWKITILNRKCIFIHGWNFPASPSWVFEFFFLPWQTSLKFFNLGDFSSITSNQLEFSGVKTCKFSRKSRKTILLFTIIIPTNYGILGQFSNLEFPVKFVPPKLLSYLLGEFSTPEAWGWKTFPTFWRRFSPFFLVVLTTLSTLGPPKNLPLGGGFKYFIFSHLLGEDFSNGLKPPTRHLLEVFFYGFANLGF